MSTNHVLDWTTAVYSGCNTPCSRSFSPQSHNHSKPAVDDVFRTCDTRPPAPCKKPRFLSRDCSNASATGKTASNCCNTELAVFSSA